MCKEAGQLKARIFNIQRFSIHDGPGIRTTVFFKGCNLRCYWCHNPESWHSESQLFVHMEQCIGCGNCFVVCPNHCHGVADGKRYYLRERCTACGLCSEACCTSALQITGCDMAVEDVLTAIVKDIPFYLNSNGGATFSGGECMLQIDFLDIILAACKGCGIHTAVDTAGDVPFPYFERILPNTDLFLYDIKCMTEALHREGTGVSNARLLDNLAKLLESFPDRVWVRIPVIPGFNADEQEFHRIAEFLKSHPKPAKVELMPYHKLGEGKRAALGMENRDRGLRLPDNDELQRYKDILRM